MSSNHYGTALSDACSGHKAFRAPNRIGIAAGVKDTLIVKQSGGTTAPWDPDETPYMVAPMNSLASRPHEATVFVGPARTGKTAGLLVGWLAHNVVNDPGDILFVQMSKDKAREFSKTDIHRALENSPKVKEMMSNRVVDDNTFDVMFVHGMWLRIAWPTIANVSGSTYRYAAITDIDRMANAEDVDGEGPLFDLAKKRTTTFMSRGMTLVESSPGKPLVDPFWTPSTPHEAPNCGGILALYNRSTRNRWYWKCPHCGERFEAKPGYDLFNLPSFQELSRLVRSGDVLKMAEQYARVICPKHGCVIGSEHKRRMNAEGIWLPEGQEFTPEGVILGEAMKSTIQGYWLGGVAAAFQSWESLLVQYFYGIQDYVLTGSEGKLKQAVTTDAGAPYMPRALAESKGTGKTPQERAELLPRHVAPEGTRCLTAAVDVQGGANARFIVQVHAVGPWMEQWCIDRFEIRDSKRPGVGTEFAPIDPAGHPEDWDLITDRVVRATWRTPLTDREIQPLLTVVDTGGEGKANGGEGVTHNAYAFYRRLRAEGLANRVALYKGASDAKAPITRATMVGGKGGKNNDVPLYLCNPNLLSDAVDGGVRREDPGPGFIHFPAVQHPVNNPDGWVTAAFFDELQAETRGTNGVWTKIKPRNETFDLCRMIRAGLLVLQLDKITDWINVPTQLRPLAENSLTVARAERRALQENERIVHPSAPVRHRRPRRSSQAAL